MNDASVLRDPSLPARAGDGALCPDSADALIARVHEHLVLANGPRPLAARIVYARWKPRASLTALYEVELDDGDRVLVTCKRYASDKARTIASGYEPDARAVAQAMKLRAAAVLPGDGVCLYTFPTDRELIGLARVTSLRRTARHWNDAGLGARVRARHSRATLVRYKPEHRAVVRLDLGSQDDPSSTRAVAARVLTPEHVERVHAVRTAFTACAPSFSAPRILHVEARTGLLYEEWLAGRACEPDDFTCARLAGRLLAALHAHATPSGTLVAATPEHVERDELAALFAVDAELVARHADLEIEPLPNASTWIHGDFHPDQVLCTPDGGAALLDWDALRPGHPIEDLASWIADALAGPRAVEFASAARPLLTEYVAAGGKMPSTLLLRARVATELVRRAAAAVRRIELDAIARARVLLARASELTRPARTAP